MPEELLHQAVDWLVLVVEAAGAVVIMTGAVTAFVLFVIAAVRRDMGASCGCGCCWAGSWPLGWSSSLPATS